MSVVGKPERETQKRLIALFCDELGYRYVGDWSDRPSNSNIEEDLLTAWLTKRGHSAEQISRAIYLLRLEADNPNRSLYDNNKAVYSYLRYGVPVKVEVGKVTETVKVIDWQNFEANDFAIAEEVTLSGDLERRPDLVLYINGIAVSVIELKNSYVSVGDGGSTYLATTTLGQSAYVTGQAALDSTRALPDGFEDPVAWGPVLMHEVGHIMGIAHVGDQGQVMYPTIHPGGPRSYGEGDRAGLRAAGAASGCLSTPQPSATTTSSVRSTGRDGGASTKHSP